MVYVIPELTSSTFSSFSLIGGSGSSVLWTTATQLLADLSVAASTVNLVPLGAPLLAVVGFVVGDVVTSGATNTFNAGDGTDPDRWGNAIAGAAGNSIGPADWTAAPGGWNNVVTDVTFTPPGAETFVSGSVRVVAYFQTITPPTS